MLRFLRIEHLAVIDAIQVEFEPGLNVLTGETGAGKSMLVEAVGLLIGGRASADLIRTGESQATVQAVFDDGPGGVDRAPRDHSARPQPRVRQRRARDGRSAERSDVAAWSSCTASTSIRRCSIHKAISSCSTSSRGLLPIARWWPRRLAQWRRLQSDFDAFQMDEREKAARLDLLKFQVDELENANPRAGGG